MLEHHASSLAEQPVNILLVEDSRDDAELAVRGLARAKLQNRIWIVDNGEEALTFLRSGARPSPDLVLLDLHLPRLSGREVLEQIRADPGLHQLPVIILTGSDEYHESQAASAADAFLTKPVNFETLSAAIREVAGLGWALVRTARA